MATIKQQLVTFQPPFRWNLHARESLGTLIDAATVDDYPEFFADLLACCVNCVALCDNADLYFVGRSPESLYDLLSGVFLGTSWARRIHLARFSMRFTDEAEVRREYPGAIAALRAYLTMLALSPRHLLARRRPVALIDIIASGATLGNFITVMRHWCADIDCDWNAIRAKIRIVGILRSEEPSPKTWRWHQHVEWARLLPRRAIKNVAVSRRLYGYLGDDQPKTTISYTPDIWLTGEASRPKHNAYHLEALRLALQLFEAGQVMEQRRAFARQMSQEDAMRHAWFRSLALEIKQ